MSNHRRDDESEVADHLRACLFWLFVTGIIASLWMFAKARNVIVGAPQTLPPPRFPTTQPAFQPPWPHAASGEEDASGATSMTDDEYYAE
jgi:hypothetical protein